MELYQALPNVLRDLQVQYLSLHELIDYDIVTPATLSNIVRNTLGPQFVDASKPDLDVLITDLFESGLDEVDCEGLTALLLLDRLDLDQVHDTSNSDHNIFELVEYFDTQSSQFKKIVYPHFVEMFNQSSSKFARDLFAHLAESESLTINSSGLDILCDSLGPDFLLYVNIIGLVEANPQFLILHIREIPVNPSLIIVATRANNRALVEILLKEFITPANINQLRHFGDKIDPAEFDDMISQLEETMPDLLRHIHSPDLTQLFPPDLILRY